MELKFLRQAARLTQKQLAELTGVDDSLISLIESGKRDISAMSYESVIRLARALNVPPEALVQIPNGEPVEPSRPTV